MPACASRCVRQPLQCRAMKPLPGQYGCVREGIAGYSSARNARPPCAGRTARSPWRLIVGRREICPSRKVSVSNHLKPIDEPYFSSSCMSCAKPSFFLSCSFFDLTYESIRLAFSGIAFFIAVLLAPAGRNEFPASTQ